MTGKLIPPLKTDRTPPIADVIRNTWHLPIESPSPVASDQFWLVASSSQWFESGRQCTATSLNLRCRHCNFGYNVFSFVTALNLMRLGEEAYAHVTTCRRMGRTLPIDSSDISHDG